MWQNRFFTKKCSSDLIFYGPQVGDEGIYLYRNEWEFTSMSSKQKRCIFYITFSLIVLGWLLLNILFHICIENDFSFMYFNEGKKDFNTLTPIRRCNSHIGSWRHRKTFFFFFKVMSFFVLFLKIQKLNFSRNFLWQ